MKYSDSFNNLGEHKECVTKKIGLTTKSFKEHYLLRLGRNNY